MSRLSRRALLAGGLGAAVLVPAAGVVATFATRRAPGRLVPDLLGGAPFYVAHRGGSDDWPECSMLAYRESVARGVDALEIPLARSADGVWFGLHDETLDRTSGTTGFVAGEHDWAEIRTYRITAEGTTDPGAPPQPYLRFQELVHTYGGTHTIFVDPKTVPREHHPELLAMMAAVPASAHSFVAKGYVTDDGWWHTARSAGYLGWGYSYGRDVDDGTTPVSLMRGTWDLLGLDVEATTRDWAAVRRIGRPMIGHIAATREEARALLADGCAGVMVSGVRAVLT